MAASAAYDKDKASRVLSAASKVAEQFASRFE